MCWDLIEEQETSILSENPVGSWSCGGARLQGAGRAVGDELRPAGSGPQRALTSEGSIAGPRCRDNSRACQETQRMN